MSGEKTYELVYAEWVLSIFGFEGVKTSQFSAVDEEAINKAITGLLKGGEVSIEEFYRNGGLALFELSDSGKRGEKIFPPEVRILKEEKISGFSMPKLFNLLEESSRLLGIMGGRKELEENLSVLEQNKILLKKVIVKNFFSI